MNRERGSAIKGAVAACWLASVGLACGLGGDEVRDALDDVAPRYAPLRATLARAAAALPPAGSVTANTCSTLQPPPRFDDHGAPLRFVWMDVQYLADTAGDTSGPQFSFQEPRLVDCLRATAPDADEHDRRRFFSAEIVRSSCDTLPELIVAVRAVEYTRPQANSAGTEFTPGALDLEAFAILPSTGAVVCQLTTVARTGGSVDFRSRAGDTTVRLEQAAVDDLRDHARRAVRQALLAPPPPSAIPPPPAGWQQDAQAALAYAVPPDWSRATTTTEPMLARWQRAVAGAALPTFFVERRPNDRGSIEQVGEEAGAALAAVGLRVVQQRSVQDGGGYEWVEVESIRPPAGEQGAIHNWMRLTVSRTGQQLLSASCGGPEAVATELAPTCQAILATVIARE